MADDKTRIAEDRRLISIHEEYEARDWAQSLDCSEAQLRDAVRAVGNSAAAVRAYLAQQKG